jgi:hypothetical protein
MENSKTPIFIEKAKIVHGDKYDYSKVNYIKSNIKVTITCPEHGDFEQKPNNHLNGQKCPNCNNIVKLLLCKENNLRKNLEKKNEFIKRAKEVHGDKYDYSLSEYINARIKLRIICPIHGKFEQSPFNHLRGTGCPICNQSKGERDISNYLTDKNIHFTTQKTFDGCKDKRKLPFDFYLPEFNTCIEFNGRQHYEVIDNWGGLEGLEDQQKKDDIKKNYCLNNKINLIIIKHDESIKEILETF